MILAPVHASIAFAAGRLDAKYHCSPGVLASERILLLDADGTNLRPVAGKGGVGSVGPTSRTKRVYAADGEESLPYLRPYDVFDYLPLAADQLSTSGSDSLERLVPETGTLLQTCSGRNLGPLAYADSYLSHFVVSDDMLRIRVENETDRFYLLAYLSTPTGQALLTRSKTGNVIDHLSADDLAGVMVPFFDSAFTKSISDEARTAVKKRELARTRLASVIEKFSSQLPALPSNRALREGWTASARSLGSRLDAAYHAPDVSEIRNKLRGSGGVVLGDVATPQMPNRYKRIYVEPGNGLPILSGRQLLQMRPVNLQYLAPTAVDVDEFTLGAGTTVFGARGRAEERVALPALITNDRAQWLASHNVMRVRPNEGVNPGWLYLCLATEHVQAQVKASAFGSVVDVVDPDNLRRVVLPPEDNESGDIVTECWAEFESASSLEAAAIARLENEILRRTGTRD